MQAERTAKRQRGRPFRKGQSGNPCGRPIGARNRATLAAEALLDGQAEKLTNKAVELALGGNIACIRLCLDRIISPRRERPVNFAIPTLRSAEDSCQAMAEITAAVSRGDLTPGEAVNLSQMVEVYVKVLELSEIECRLKVLEDRHLGT